MKRTTFLSCVAVMTIASLCSTALAHVGCHFLEVSPPTQVQPLAEFDISQEVNSLRQKKAIRDETVRNVKGSKEEMAAAVEAANQAFEREKAAAFELARNRLLEQRRQVRVRVTNIVSANADEELKGPHQVKGRVYHTNGDVRIDCPYPGLKVIDGSFGQLEICRCKLADAKSYSVSHRCENNGFTFNMMIPFVVGVQGEHWFVYKISADFGYDDATLNQITNRDLEVIKIRILNAL